VLANPQADAAVPPSDAATGEDASITDAGTPPDANTVLPDAATPDAALPDAALPDAATSDAGICGVYAEIEPNDGFIDVLGNDVGTLSCDLTLTGTSLWPTDLADGFRLRVSAAQPVSFTLNHDANGADLDLGLYATGPGLDGVLGTADDVVTQLAFSQTAAPATTETIQATLQPGVTYDLVVHAMSGSASYTIQLVLQ
jgi:hypothetical protein